MDRSSWETYRTTQFRCFAKMDGAAFALLIVTVLIKGFLTVSSHKICYIVSEFDPQSPSKQQQRWSLPYSDPCECTSIRLGGAFSQDMSRCLKVKPFYLETLILSEDREEIREFFKCPPVCSDALGMGSWKIPDSSLSASTAGNTGYGPKKARLNTNGAYCSSDPANNWYRVSLDETVTLTGLITQGRHYSNVWTKTFKVKLGVAGNQLEYVTGADGLPIEFLGNTDHGTQVTNSFPEAVRANVIQIEPVEVERAFCIRFELLGCRDSD
ncbi:lactadherin-like [Asterias rubens]|uniref:lactadherin-like n=1 Tax=Asterias rubens TaxID=7604 RepID=UPI0014554DEB|nr:lactadherin-like [Asterias rubens]